MLGRVGSGNEVGADDALRIVNEYFDAFDEGEFDTMTSLLSPADSTRFARVCTGACTYFDTWSFDYYQRYYAYKIAQGTLLEGRDCTLVDQSAGDVTVACNYLEQEYVAGLVGAPGSPTTATVTVAPDGIAFIEFAYEGGAPAHAVGTQFKSWMSRLHPTEWGLVGQSGWTSIVDAQERGELTARYGDEWAAYLDTNGCSYVDNC